MEKNIIHTRAVERLEQFVREKRIIRHKWTGVNTDGRETACLLAALSPEVGVSHEATDCPAGIMPQWLAELTPWLDDAPSDGAWWGFVERFVAVTQRWSVLTPEAWRRLDYACRAVAVREARRQVAGREDARVAEAVDGVLALGDRAAGGGDVGADEWAEQTAAWATAWAEAAADRIADGILRAIESACDVAEPIVT